MKVYFISGLGADRRVFKNIRLPQGYEAEYLDWITPQQNEALSHYASRLSGKIDSSEPFILIGLSFGGMIATEISRKMHPQKTILISSVSSPKQLPGYFRVGSVLNVYKAIPYSTISSISFVRRFFTTESAEDRLLLYQMVKDTDPMFLRWAVGAILNWKSESEFAPSVHIHGTSDKILPLRYTNPTHRIIRAGHAMVLNRSEEISSIIAEVLGGG